MEISDKLILYSYMCGGEQCGLDSDRCTGAQRWAPHSPWGVESHVTLEMGVSEEFAKWERLGKKKCTWAFQTDV